ncbi:MAG: hypothetical protein A2Z12_02145 [Actinobacteria bacterium RBG_16_68_21]|nr:MAG: hypothetical protein A2Z12_02145 [Actinobacteria bacterium RBG_16_68_21]
MTSRPELRTHSTAGRWVLVATILASGIVFLDFFVVNVSLEAIRTDLGASFTAQQWVIAAYGLTLGAFLLLGGSLGDLLGRRRLFVVGMAWFGIASLACGAAPTIGTLVAFRALQGVGAALLVPSSLAIIQATFHPADRAAAIGVWSGVSGLSTIIGPFLGGWLTDAVSWRLVFLINPPIIAFAMWVALRHVPETRRTEAGQPDILGAILIALTLGSFVFVLIQGRSMGWTDPVIVGLLAAGVIGFVGFLLAEAKGRDPMIPLGLFRSMQFSGTNLATLFIYFALSGMSFLVVLQLLGGLGYSSLESGAALAPITLLLFVMSPWAGRLATRIGPRVPMSVGPLVAALGAVLATRIVPGTHYLTTVLPGLIVLGIGLGVTVAPLTAAALAALDQELAGVASGVNNAVARIAGLLAAALLPFLAGLSGVEAASDPAFSPGFQRAMWICAACLLTGSAISALTVRRSLLTDDAG